MRFASARPTRARRAPIPRPHLATREDRGRGTSCPRPSMRSRTVRETTISPSSAAAITRAAMCTATPETSLSSATSMRPACRPTRTVTPIACELRPQLHRAFERRRRVGEHREDAVAGRLHQSAPLRLDHVVGDRPVHTDHRAPRAVAERLGHLGRPDDVAEQDRRELLLRRDARVASDERAEAAEDQVGGLPEHRAVRTRKLDALRPVDVVGEVATVRRRDQPVLGAVHDERGHVQLRQLST